MPQAPLSRYAMYRTLLAQREAQWNIESISAIFTGPHVASNVRYIAFSMKSDLSSYLSIIFYNPKFYHKLMQFYWCKGSYWHFPLQSNCFMRLKQLFHALETTVSYA